MTLRQFLNLAPGDRVGISDTQRCTGTVIEIGRYLRVKCDHGLTLRYVERDCDVLEVPPSPVDQVCR